MSLNNSKPLPSVEVCWQGNRMVLLGFLFLVLSPLCYGHGMSEAEKQLIIEGGNLGYLKIGATHMLSGYDHLLFVFGIVFFLSRFIEVVKYISAFTLGHSVTLIVATFEGVQVNYLLIDAVIALSVCYIAFVNLGGFQKQFHFNPPNMLLVIMGFGLIHGLGLSTRLQQLPLSEEQLLMNIISFNVGVEVGQIAALGFMLVMIAWARKSAYFLSFGRVANTTLVLAGAFLFLVQMHDYSHSGTLAPSLAESGEAGSGSVAVSSSVATKTAASVSWKETLRITVPAAGDIEYKLQMDQGALLEYAWQTDGPALFFDFHGEPAGDTTGYFKSYKKSTHQRAKGSLTAPFSGVHGWYWKNYTASAVTVYLKVRGDYQRLDLSPESQQLREAPAEKPLKTHDTL